MKVILNKIANHSKIKDWKYIIPFLFGICIVSIVIATRRELSASANHGGLLPFIFPAFIFLCTLVMYLLSRLFIKKWSWIIALIGCIGMITFAIDWLITEN